MPTLRGDGDPDRGPAADAQRARQVAATVTDPEMPMLTLEDLGVLREVTVDEGAVVVAITPTYSGCPAMATMRDDLVHRLRDAGFPDVRVRVELTPPGRATGSPSGAGQRWPTTASPRPVRPPGSTGRSR